MTSLFVKYPVPDRVLRHTSPVPTQPTRTAVNKHNHLGMGGRLRCTTSDHNLETGRSNLNKNSHFHRSAFWEENTWVTRVET